MDGERKGLLGRGELAGVYLATDRITLGPREVVSVPLSADFTLSKFSGSPCVSVPMLTAIGNDTGSRNMGPGPGVLKGVFVIVSSCLRKEGRTKEVGVAKEMGSGVGPEGGVGNSLIRSAIGSSSPVCMVSFWPLVLVSQRRMSLSLPPLIP